MPELNMARVMMALVMNVLMTTDVVSFCGNVHGGKSSRIKGEVPPPA